MKRYEYELFHYGKEWSSEILRKLNQLGSKGWSVVATLTSTELEGPAILLMREIIDLEPANEQKVA
jgi:hypothetical protein